MKVSEDEGGRLWNLEKNSVQIHFSRVLVGCKSLKRAVGKSELLLTFCIEALLSRKGTESYFECFKNSGIIYIQ